MSEGYAIGRTGFPPRLLATGLTDEEAQAQLLPGEQLAAIAAIPDDLNAVYLLDGQLRPRTRLDFDAPAAGAMVSVDGAAPIAAVDWIPPTVPGTYRISAVGPFIGQRTIVVRSIEDARAQRWEATKAARDRAEWAGCATQLGRVDTDPDSQRKVSGSVQMAMIAQAAGAPFDLAWTMQDNRTVIHDAVSMIAMGIAVGQHVAACHAIAIAKRAAIDAAETVEAVAAVDIEGGWPDA